MKQIARFGSLLAMCLAAAALIGPGCTPESSGSGGSIGTCQVADCPVPESECEEAACKAGECAVVPIPDGEDGAVQKAGDCLRNVCDKGAISVLQDPTDTPADEGNDCTVEVCEDGAGKVVNAEAGAPCATNGGAVCDGAGQCLECLTAGDCGPGEDCSDDSTCVPGQCMNGVQDQGESDVDCGGPCGDTCALGKACGAAADCASGFCAEGLCCDKACDGECEACSEAKTGEADGTCLAYLAGTDPEDECDPQPDDPCGNTDGMCSGKASCNKIAAGIECAPFSLCDGSGGCKLLAGLACATGDDCLSGSCADGVCCAEACDGLCEACVTAKTGNLPDGTCGPNGAGTDPDAECAGTQVCNGMGACTGLLPGADCTIGAECASGFCVDGVCCTMACNGACQGCSLAVKGNGQDGTCGAIASGLDPDDECLLGTACNGGGSCNTLANGASCTDGAECGSGFCVDGVCCSAACGGACQACSAAKKGNGGSGTCGPIATGTDPDDECAGATVCDAMSSCKLPNQEPCSMNAECVSGSCADGVCCNSACSGLCQACSAAKKGAGQDGTCASIQNGGDPDDECGGATVCNGAGACALLAQGAACALDAECQSASCADGFCCNTACTNLCEACSAAKKGTGQNGTCGAVIAGNDPDSECAGSLVCNGSGLCKGPLGNTCAASTDCLSGFCVDGVCCNTACNTACQACSAAKSGLASDGTCGSIPVATDPDNECAGAASCNGSGACSLLALGAACSLNAECQSSQCVDGVCCNTSCNGLCQACTATKKGSGSDGTCGAVAVGSDPDAECPGITACNGASCALLATGSPCSVNGECQSTQCVDGVCCNTACGGLCQACSAAKKGSGSDGSCGNVGAGLDPDSECAGSLVCNGAGVCQ